MNIREIRQAYPQYNDLSDKQLADALREKYYPDMPVDEFYRRVELKSPEGFLPATQRGLEALISSGRTAFESVTGSPEEAAKRALEREKELEQRLPSQVSLERVKKAYAERGLLPAAGEAVSQVPYAIAEQAPNLLAMLGLSTVGKRVAGPVGAITGLGASSYVPMLGSNIQRQAQEQVERGEPININMLAAAGAAVPQTLFDVAGSLIPLGGRLVSKLTGIPAEALLGRSAAQVEKLANEKLLATLAKGTAIGAVAEVPTEVVQQMLERAQAGLSLTSPDALKEYGETAYQVGLLAPIGAAGRLSDRAGARQEVAQRQMAEKARADAEARAAEAKRLAEQAAYRQTPEYLDDIQKRYDALVRQETQLTEATKVKPEGKDPASIEIANRAKKEASERLREFKQSDDYQATLEEYIQARPLLSGRIQAQARAEEAFGKQPLYEPEDLSPAAQAKKLQDRINELRKQQDKLATPAEKQPLENQIYDLEQSLAPYALSDEEYRLAESKLKGLLDGTPEQTQKDFGTIPAREGLREKLQKATSNADLQRIAAEIARVETAQRELEKLKPFVKTVTKQPTVFELRDQVDKAQAKGDIAALQRLTPMLAEAEKQPDLFEVARAEDLERGKLQEEIEAGRKEAEKQRLRVQAEIDSLRSIRDKIKERTARGMTAELWREELAKQQNRRYQSARNDYNRIKKATEELAALEKQKADAAAIDLKRNELQALTELSRRNADNLDALLKLQTERGKLVRQKAEADALAAKDAEIKAVQDRMQAEADAVDKEKTLRQSLALLQQQRASKDAIAAKQKEIDEVMLRPVTQTELGKPRKKGEVQPSFRKPYEDLRPYEERALEREANVEESDKRVDALLNNLLGMFTGTEKEKAPMFDIEAQKKAAQQIPEGKETQKSQTKQKLADAQDRKQTAYDELSYVYKTKNSGEKGVAYTTKIQRLRNQFLEAALEETDIRRELAGGEPLSVEYRQDLRNLLRLVLDDLGRLDIRRNADNSYDYGEVNGLVGVQTQPIEGAITPTQAAALQKELEELRELRIVLDERASSITELVKKALGIDSQAFLDSVSLEKINAALGSDAPLFKVLRDRQASVNQRIDEIAALLSAYTRGEGLATVVVEGKTQGSNAPLAARALGAPAQSVAVLEEQANELVGEFAEFKQTPLEAKAAQEKTTGGTRFQVRREAPIEQAANLLERKRDLQSLLDNYNAEIQKESRLPNLEKIQEKIDKATTAASKERHEAAYKAATEKIARVNDLKELRDFTAQELDAVTKRYNRLVELQTPGYEAARAEATTADLFGPLEEARTTQQDIQDELDKLYARRDQIKADLQRRGKVGETPALQALVEQYSKDTPLLRATEAAIEQLEQDLKLATGKTSARYDAFVAAREQERAPEAEDRRTRTLPGFERRAGVRPVDPAQLAEARTQLVALQNTEQELKRSLASADVDPTRMLREVAIRKQNELESIRKKAEAKDIYGNIEEPSAAVRNAIDTLRAEVKYFSNVIKGRNRKALRNALTETQKRQDAVRGRIDELERRQRAYEQQEAVRTGATPGTVEAQRLIEGGYRTATGEIRTKPKNLASWGVTEITKKNATPAAPAKVAATSNMLRQYQKETAEAATASAAAKETLERQLNRATKNLTNLTNALEQVYPESVAAKTDEEITNLLASGFTPEGRAAIKDMAQVYTNLKNSVAGNTSADVVARLETEIERLQKQRGRFAGLAFTTEKELEVFRDVKIKIETKQRRIENTVDAEIKELREIIQRLKTVPPRTDPWVASFNALIAETNAKALTAAQELSFSQIGFTEVQKAVAAVQEKIDALKNEPMTSAFSARMSNLEYAYDRQLERLQELNVEVLDKQTAYKTARLEQLNLLRAYGQDLQRTIAVEAERIKSLTPQLEAQAKATAEADKKLKKAEQLLSAARVAERKKAEAPAPAAPDVYTQAEREALGRIREGIGLSGTQYTRDTTSRLVTLTKKTIRDTLNLRQAELNTLQAQVEAAKRRLAAAQAEQSDAVREGKPRDIEVADSRVQNALRDLNEVEVANRDQVQDLTQKVQELERAYEAVYDLGERKVTGVGEEAYTDLTAAPESPFAAAKRYFPELEAAGMAPVEGERLPRRRVGPVTRVGTQPPGQMLSGTAESREAISKGNRPAQAGRVRLTAADLDLQKASSVNLAVLKQQLDVATGDRKTQLQAAYNAATKGLSAEQIKDKIKEGNDLIKLPGAAAVVAARERSREALANLQKAEADLKEAKTPAAKEVAKDVRDSAYQAWELSEAKLEQARAAVASGVALTDTPKKTVEVAIADALMSEVKKETKKRGRKTAAEAIEDVYADEEGGPELGTTFRMEEQTLATDAAMNYMKLGQVQSAIEQLTADGTTDLIRQSAKDLLPFLKDVKVKFDRNLTLADGREVPAAYDPTTNTMYFRPSELTEENIIHEGTHAATIAVLTLPDSQLTDRQRNAKKELEAIFTRLKKDTALDQEYGLTDIKEFVSEVQSNAGFRAAIDQMPWYKRLWNAILRLIGKEPMEALSKRAERFVKEIYTESRPIAAPTVGAAPTSSIVGREAGTFDTLKGNLFGLAGRVQFFDRLGAADEALVRAKNAGALSDLEAFQTQYYLRLSDMTTQAAGQFMTSGPVKIVAEDVGGMKEYRYESQSGPTLINVSEYMEQAAKAGLGTPEKVETMLTVLIAGDRANALSDGWKRLAGDKAAAAKAEYDSYRQELRANPQAAQFIEAAKAEYKRYNDGLLDFAEQTGFLTPEEVRGLKRMPYVPFYRIQNGEVRLFTDKETSIRIGNIKDNPDLQRLIGDNKEILPILTSAAQNTFMLTRMGLRNKATQETANALFKAGFVSAIDRGMGPANPNTVHYKVRGEHHFAVIDSDQFGIPADLIVKGMEGIKTTIPGLVRAMGVPADWVRKFVTRSPAYVLRQLMRDPVNAAIIGGVDGVPVMNALKQMAQMRAGLSPEAEALQRGLVVNSNVFTGDERDMEVFMRSIATGRGKWAKMMSEFDKLALQADAATRTTIYADSIGKGLSKARASFRALEAQNFSRRGLSPTMQALNTIVPFFNAQLQGLDVLYRSLTNKMPFAEQLEIRKKLVTRGLMLAATAMTYALFMQNDDEYKKLEPEVRYGNFLIKTPFFKDFLAIPIPYEIGILFKALPEMLIDMASKDTAAKDAAFGLGKLLWQSAPSVIPAMPKPFLEAAYGQTQFGPIESEREKKLPAAQRARETTPEVLKMVGGITGAVDVSPLMLEHFLRAYTGALGLSILRLPDPLLRPAGEGEKASLRESQYPLVGGLFKSTEGRFLVDRAYARMQEIEQAVNGYEDLMKRGKRAEAAEFAQRKANLMAAEEMAGAFRKSVGEAYKDEREIRAAPNLTQEQKDKLIEQIRKARNLEAEGFYKATEKFRSAPLRPGA